MYDNERKLEWSLDSEEYFRRGDLISLRWHWYQDAGGAHPSHGTSTMNFAGQQLGLMTLEHLFGHRDEVIAHINRYAQVDIKRHLLAVRQDTDIDFDIMLCNANLWDVYKQFNFNEREIVFNLSPYDVLPYVFGSFEVEMPWDYFRDKINESYDGTEFSELISAIFD